MKRYIRLSIVGLALVVFIGLGVHSQANAITVDSSQLNLDTTCNTGSDASFTGLLPVPLDTYNVYARLPTSGQSAVVAVFGQVRDDSSSCMPIGTTQASGDKWSLVGTWNAKTDNTDTVFQLSSPTLNSTLGANRPSVMLISKTHPTCQPTTECTVTIAGEQGFVRPIGTLPNQDSLHIVRPIDPSQDSISKVTYYVDGEPAYTTRTLLPFDLRYVTVSNQSLARVIDYSSSQRIVLNESVPDGFNDNFFNFLFRLYQSNPRLILAVAGIVGLAIIGAIVLAVIRKIHRHHEWQLDHGFAQQNIGIVTDADRRKAFSRDRQWMIIRTVIWIVIGLAFIMTLVVTVNTFIVKLYKVDGHSMESTYHDTTEQVINVVPVTLAHIAGRDYTPDRGQVVIVRQVFGVTDDVQAADKENQYLIKRVIGLPGERVVVKNNTITIYNTEHPDGFNPDTGSTWEKTMHVDTDAENVDVTLAKDEIFICGDNRPESIDSRFNGPILTKQIIGIVN